MPQHDALHALLQRPDAPSGLPSRIIQRIERSIVRRLCMEIGAVTAITLGFIGYLISVWSTIWIELRESSLIEFGRLAWSDPDVIFSNIGETLWSIAEMLPMELILAGLFLVLCATCLAGFVLRLREVHHQSPLLS